MITQDTAKFTLLGGKGLFHIPDQGSESFLGSDFYISCPLWICDQTLKEADLGHNDSGFTAQKDRSCSGEGKAEEYGIQREDRKGSRAKKPEDPSTLTPSS